MNNVVVKFHAETREDWKRSCVCGMYTYNQNLVAISLA